MNEFMNESVLGTFSGMVATVTILTQFIKHYVKRCDPKWIALVVSVAAVMAIAAWPGAPSYQSIFMAADNVLLVAGSSIGLFEGGKSVGKTLGFGE